MYHPTLKSIRGKYFWPENLVVAVVGEEEYRKSLPHPGDFMASIEYVLALLRTRKDPRCGESVEGYFKYDRSLEDIASGYQVTRERARQLIEMGLAYLRHPDRSRYLAKGVAKVVSTTRDNAYDRGHNKARKDFEFDVKAAYVRGRSDALNSIPSDDATVLGDISRMFGVMQLPITQLGLKSRSVNALFMGGYSTLGHILYISDAELIGLRNCGELTIRDIKEVVSKYRDIPFEIWSVYMHQYPPANKTKRK